MNLIKSFNFNFLKQNIRKSKGIIILSLIIVPLILSMYLVVSGLRVSSTQIVPTEVIGSINLFFMYIIPFVYSAILFGFVFKKPSTDFMNSMPINRTTMFVTNTLGGIILITLIELLSGFFALLWGAIFSNLIIFPSEILDIMIISWISYIFVFTAANLAMSFSGTQQTQFVVTVLILFLVPVCIELINSIRQYKTYSDNIYSYSDSYGYNQKYDISIANGYQTTYFDTLEKVKNYTMPFKLLRYGLNYSLASNIRMVVLSIVYFSLGLKLYQKRKMEYSEETFSSQKLHILAKSLTLIPILLVVNMLNAFSESITALVIAIIFCAIYYFVFDIVSKRKVPFITTIVSFSSTVFIIQALTAFLGNIEYKQLDIDAEDIKAISIGTNSHAANNQYYYYVESYEKNSFDGDYFIEDRQILDLILDGKNKLSNPENYNLSDDGYVGKDIYFNIKLRNGKEYYIRTTINNQNYNEIIRALAKNDDYVEHMKKQIYGSNGIIQVGNDVVDNKTKRKIENAIKENLDDINVLSINTDSINYITKSVYKNHKVVEYKIPLNNNEELLSVVAEFANRQALENIKGYQYGVQVTVYDRNKNVGSFYDNSKILDFMEMHGADEFDPTQKYYVLSGGLETRRGYKNFIFYTNSMKEIDSIINDSTSRDYWY